MGTSVSGASTDGNASSARGRGCRSGAGFTAADADRTRGHERVKCGKARSSRTDRRLTKALPFQIDPLKVSTIRMRENAGPPGRHRREK